MKRGFYALVLLGCLALIGCAPVEEELVKVDATKELAVVKAEAEKADKETTELMVKSYDAAITAAKKELSRQTNNFNKIKVVELNKTQIAKDEDVSNVALRESMAKLEQDIKALEERKAVFETRLESL